MRNPVMNKKRVVFPLAIALLIAFGGSSARVSYADVAVEIADFYAGCSNFNVDVWVTGTTDDGGGLDKFRYQIVDGAGHLLYQEDAARPIDVIAGNTVYGVAYQNGAVPTQNPVTFKVIDLDKDSNPGKLLREGFYDARCLPSSGKGHYGSQFKVPDNAALIIHADSAIYETPDGKPTTNQVYKGESRGGVYRTPDNRWVGLFTGGNVLGWVPASVVRGPYTLLPMRAVRIERVYVNGFPDGLFFLACSTGSVPTFVHNAPNIDAPEIGLVEEGTYWQITGKVVVPVPRSPDEQWLRINYNGQTGWVLYVDHWVCLRNARIIEIPVLGT